MSENETRINVRGTPYVLPMIASIDLDEAIIIYDFSGMTIAELYDLEDFNPKVIKALLYIAIQRSDPSFSAREINEMLKVNMLDLYEQFLKVAEGREDPTQGGALPPDDDSKLSSDESTPSSGADGESVSELSQEKLSLVSTGVPISDSVATSSQEMSVP